ARAQAALQAGGEHADVLPAGGALPDQAAREAGGPDGRATEQRGAPLRHRAAVELAKALAAGFDAGADRAGARHALETDGRARAAAHALGLAVGELQAQHTRA